MKNRNQKPDLLHPKGKHKEQNHIHRKKNSFEKVSCYIPFTRSLEEQQQNKINTYLSGYLLHPCTLPNFSELMHTKS
jgi:hypothetical protein